MTIGIQDGLLYALMFFGPDCWYENATHLNENMFDGERREIFAAIAKLNHEGTAVDSIIVADALPDETAEIAVGIGSVCHISRSSVKSYVEHLRKSWAIKVAKDIGAVLSETGDVEAAKSALLAIQSGQVSKTVGMEDASRLLIDDLTHRAENRTAGLQTGLKALDSLLGGIEPSDLCVIAGRPGMGKTALMLNIATNADCPAAIFSLEMSTAQLMTRMVASHGIDYGKLRRPFEFNKCDWPKVTQATVGLNKRNIWINDTGRMSIGAIESESYRLVKTFGVKLICLDYLQLATCKSESRFEEVSEISRRLKALAKNLDVSVIALSQMNRAIEKRGTPKPTLSDLRESGQIEQDADQIIFTYRPEAVQEGARAGEADLIVEKNRGGETGTATVAWEGKYQRFTDYQPR
jgi:replicative DNA helicase